MDEEKECWEEKSVMNHSEYYGRNYWLNLENGKSQWGVPLLSGETLPFGWEKHMSSNFISYYENIKTRKTQWAIPEISEEELPKINKAWIIQKSKNCGTIYYRHTQTGVTQWDVPLESAVEDEEEDDEGECELDGRLDACKKNNNRERLLWECFKGMPVTHEALRKSFACRPDQVKAMVTKLISEHPSLRESVIQIGGQGKNYDYTFQESGNSVNIELKTNKASSSHESLIKVPWSGYGQLLQLFLNVKDPKYSPLFKSFDTEGMIRNWFDNVIIREIAPKYGIEGQITFESYYTMLFKSAKTAAKKYNDASLSIGTRALFKYFHEHRTKEDNAYRATLWKRFSKGWMDTHKFNDALVLELLQATLNKKHIWICTTKNDAYIIEGPRCVALSFKALKTGKDATVLVYNTTLTTPSTGISYSVEVKFRFYWKNGGQGVHNLCLQIS
jgi:hypothetical protein